MISGFLAVLLFTAPQAIPAEPGQLDASPSVFTVLAAINAAGYDAQIDSPTNSPLRRLVRQELAARNLPVVADLKRFFGNHRQKDPAAELGQYLAFALCVDGPPNFRYRYRSNELPPEVVALDGFEKLAAQFYKEANLEELWRKAQPYYQQALARYHAPVADGVMRVNAYLRNSAGATTLGARFQIFVALLGAPNQVRTYSFRNDYFVVATPSVEPQAEEIRHAYLHFQLDGLASRYSNQLDKKKGLLDLAQAAPLLPDQDKSDFLLLATECLIKAVETRLAPASQRPGLVDQAFKEGYILVPAFAELLPAYEKQEQSLRFYYPDLIAGIDLKKEDERLAQVQFSSERPERRIKVPVEQPVEPTGPQKALAEAEQLYLKRDLERAQAAYMKVLQETDQPVLHAGAYYGLARIALLKRDPETAQKLFEKTLASSPDAQTAAWSYVYLGRLADAAGQRDEATKHYQAALGVNGASPGARDAARKGLIQPFTKQKTQQP